MNPRGCDPPAVPRNPEIDRDRGALIGTFVGDALGMPFEGAAIAEMPEWLESWLDFASLRRGAMPAVAAAGTGSPSWAQRITKVTRRGVPGRPSEAIGVAVSR